MTAPRQRNLQGHAPNFRTTLVSDADRAAYTKKNAFLFRRFSAFFVVTNTSEEGHNGAQAECALCSVVKSDGVFFFYQTNPICEIRITGGKLKQHCVGQCHSWSSVIQK